MHIFNRSLNYAVLPLRIDSSVIGSAKAMNQAPLTTISIMKKIILQSLFFFAASLFFQNLSAQPIHLKVDQVPAKVKIGFDKKYPQGSDVIWQKEENGLFSAQFWDADNDIYVNAYMEEDGTWSKSTMEVTTQSFTEAIRQYMKTNYLDDPIANVFATQENDGRVTFKVQLEKENKLITLFFDKSANVLNKTEEIINFEITEE